MKSTLHVGLPDHICLDTIPSCINLLFVLTVLPQWLHSTENGQTHMHGFLWVNSNFGSYSPSFIKDNLLLDAQHQYNNGETVSYPRIKKIITLNSWIVPFFNSLHYWGGQLEIITRENKVTCGLKTNTESCFYVLILQALSVWDHKALLTTLCPLKLQGMSSQLSLTSIAGIRLTRFMSANPSWTLLVTLKLERLL